MIRILLADSLLALSVSAASSIGAEPESYSTDWLTPAVRINDELPQVCAMELAVAQQNADSLTGTITLFSGQPVSDQWGDADRQSLATRKFAVTLRQITAPQRAAPGRPPT